MSHAPLTADEMRWVRRLRSTLKAQPVTLVLICERTGDSLSVALKDDVAALDDANDAERVGVNGLPIVIVGS